MNLESRENPFTPTFGEVPPHLAGRSEQLAELKRAFHASNRHPSLTTVITGARGTGKTALLTLAAEEAEQNGWIAARSVAMPGMLDDILITARRRAAHLVPASAKPKLTGIEVAQLARLEWENERQQTNWRNEMSALLELLEESGIGLLISVDEARADLDELVQLVAIYQLFVTEQRKVALLMAGLPHNVLQLENDKTVSFLRRAQKIQLDRIPDFEVEDAMLRTIEETGRSIAPKALEKAVIASDGFPFLMQLIGFRMWDRHPGNPQISLEDAEAGIRLAEAEMRERIVKTTYNALSAGDRSFLKTLAEAGGRAKTAEVARLMGKSTSYSTQYKKRLLGQGVIGEAGDGTLSFELPLMHEYVLEMSSL